MKPLPVGATIGLLGGGQLGRMIALEGRSLGYRFICWDPTPGCPAESVCDEAITAPFTDKAAEKKFASSCDLITFEWENIPAELVLRLQAKVRVRPEPSVLAVVQDRLVQRTFLAAGGFPQTRYEGVNDAPSLVQSVKRIGFPCLLKTRRFGYDGKGQTRLKSAADLKKIKGPLNHILERHVAFKKEISVILARREDGKTSVFPIAENVHRHGVLHTTLAPAVIPAHVAKKAKALALSVAQALNFVGVLAVEMFLVGDELLINEIAPRVHNSGHYTWGACRTSQFEQHVRAVAGLPFGDATQHSDVVMVNLLGDLWKKGEPRWDVALAESKLFLYGKAKPAPGRKMGHLLLLGRQARLSSVDKLLKKLAA